MWTTKKFLTRKILKPLGLNLEYYRHRPFVRFLKKTGKKDLIGVEIGVYDGWNALDMLETLPIKKLYLIDPYVDDLLEKNRLSKSKEIAKKALKKYKDKIVFIYDFSQNVVDLLKEEVDFIYIDGDHRYEGIKRDLELYYPKVKKGGVIGGHDYTSSPETEEKGFGVFKAVQEFFKKQKIYFHNIDWWVIKK